MSNGFSTRGPGERPSAWLNAAREGDRKAREQLVNHQRADLLTLAENQLESDLRVKESPSDLVQKSLLEGLQSFDAFHGQSVNDFANYMRAILRNNVQDARRRYVEAEKRSLSRERPGVDPDAHPDSVSNTPSQFIQRQDEAATLRRSLAQLSPAHQRILSLRFWEDMTFDQIGEVVGQKPDAVRKSFYRAMAALSRAVQNTGTQTE
jgi:RNA polymerase sigma-70 factor, ECF subfamily